MALVRTKDVVVKVKTASAAVHTKHGSAAVAAFNNSVTLTDDEAKLLVAPIKLMTSIVETTGVGDARKRRRDAMLADIGNVDISGLLDPTDADGLYECLNEHHKQGAPFELEVEYAASKSIKALWLVDTLEMDPAVGNILMVKGTLQAEGGGYANTLS